MCQINVNLYEMKNELILLIEKVNDDKIFKRYNFSYF